MKKKTSKTKAYAALAGAVFQPAKTAITNCTFIGVKWDAKAVESVHTVARALENLTRLFQSQQMTVPMVLVGDASKPTLTINGHKPEP